MGTSNKERIVVVGGGAGGLELVVRLAKKMRRRPVEVVLVDRNPSHIWKPLFHEVATGSMDSYHDEAAYRSLARKHRFTFLLGEVNDIDLDERTLTVGPVDDELGRAMLPGRTIRYDRLVVAVGSHSNDFGIAGVTTHARQLDSREQAERFHTRFVAELNRVNSLERDDAELAVVIVGGGATGVELAADMHNVAKRLREYGYEHFSQERLSVSIIEAAPGLLPRLPERIGMSVEQELGRIGVTVRTGTMVSAVEEEAVVTSDGERIRADISVWAAGVRAPAWLAETG
ncbi:MAG: FAD-dependent oxidoreductase, partial [Pseudomonadota bacterium]